MKIKPWLAALGLGVGFCVNVLQALRNCPTGR